VKSGLQRWVCLGMVLVGVLLPLGAVAEPRTCGDHSCRSEGPALGSRVLPKDGPCGVGFYASGNYCISYADRRAVPKAGACGVGFFPSGRYCVTYE